jgi:hypothetical protein
VKKERQRIIKSGGRVDSYYDNHGIFYDIKIRIYKYIIIIIIIIIINIIIIIIIIGNPVGP